MSVPIPEGMPLLDAGAHRDARSGSCLMEYVSVLSGERFTDRPGCTHPAVSALAWQINDAVSHSSRQELGPRAADLVGVGRGLDVPVRPIVLGVIAHAGLALDPQSRFFPRLRERLERVDPAAGRDGEGGRVATLLHVGPVNHACAHLLVAMRVAGLGPAARDRALISLLDEVVAAVRAEGDRSRPGATASPRTLVASRSLP